MPVSTADKKMDSTEEHAFDEKFKPKGAMAFFVVLMLICAVIWYGIYYISLSRQ